MNHPRREQIIEFGKQNIHVLANSIAELTTDTPHVIEPSKKTIPDVPVQPGSGFQRLPEHMREGIEVSRVSMIYVPTESNRALAVKDKQLS
jgi:hypothetical protein